MQRHWQSWTSPQHFPRMTMVRGCRRQPLLSLHKVLACEANSVMVEEAPCACQYFNPSIAETGQRLAAAMGEAAEAPDSVLISHPEIVCMLSQRQKVQTERICPATSSMHLFLRACGHLL